MSRPQTERVTEALRLIDAGMPLRKAAEATGASKTTLVNARKRAGAGPLPAGRPASQRPVSSS